MAEQAPQSITSDAAEFTFLQYQSNLKWLKTLRFFDQPNRCILCYCIRNIVSHQRFNTRFIFIAATPLETPKGKASTWKVSHSFQVRYTWYFRNCSQKELTNHSSCCLGYRKVAGGCIAAFNRSAKLKSNLQENFGLIQSYTRIALGSINSHTFLC